jgi:hypothetical protein
MTAAPGNEFLAWLADWKATHPVQAARLDAETLSAWSADDLAAYEGAVRDAVTDFVAEFTREARGLDADDLIAMTRTGIEVADLPEDQR